MSETTTAAAHAAQEGAKAGMPQLDFSTFPNQIFWLVVTLLVIYFVLSRVALPRIGGTIANRKGTITTDLAVAEELKQKAVAAEAAYQAALVSARTEADQIVAAARADIQADLNKAIAAADADIAKQSAASAQRIDDMRAGAAEAVTSVAKDTAAELIAALGGKADAAAITAAVSARLKG